jgi:GTP-binding protein Era
VQNELHRDKENTMSEWNQNDKTAFIAIVGRPNVGKSSLLNAILGQKVAIVSGKPQTTRTRIMGVLTEGEDQLVFIDTPGLHKPKNKLGNYMVKSVTESVAGVDAGLLVIEADTKISPADLELIDKFKALDMPAVLAINKIDTIKDKSVLMEQIQAMTELFPFEAIVPISALDGSGVKILIEELKKLCVEGGHFFPEDTLTDQPERVLAGEIIREKLLRLLDKEIPHGIAVSVERMRERDDDSGITDINATILCERDSHKAIVIGKKGAMLKKVGMLARSDMERFFDCKINLQLWVKVKEDWRNRQNILHALGYDKTDFQ